jgi:hypothetical protein
MTRATVLMPTHDHGHLLRHATETALVQSVSDIEVFVVLDGADDTTRTVAQDLARGDDRVRFFDFPKGKRHGEAHRHLALGEATNASSATTRTTTCGSPTTSVHGGLLQHADLPTHSPSIRPNGEIENPVGDPTPYYRQRLLDHISINFVGLLNAGRTLEMYRTWPRLGTCTPGVPADLMWRRFFRIVGEAEVGGASDSLRLDPSPGMPLEARLENSPVASQTSRPAVAGRVSLVPGFSHGAGRAANSGRRDRLEHALKSPPATKHLGTLCGNGAREHQAGGA